MEFKILIMAYPKNYIFNTHANMMDAWKKKVIAMNGAYYVNIPMPIIKANGKRKGSVVEFLRVFDEKTGKIMVVVCF